MSEEELQEQIILQIEVLVEELGGTMCHLTKCTYTGLCLLYTSPSPRDVEESRMPSSA